MTSMDVLRNVALEIVDILKKHELPPSEALLVFDYCKNMGIEAKIELEIMDQLRTMGVVKS